MIQFREKLYNASTNDTRPGNLLDTSLYDEVEQIMIDSSVKDVQYYYVRTPDSVWRKTEYYEILPDMHALIFKVNDTVYQTLYFRTGEAISDTAIEYTAPGMEFQGWTDSIPAVMPDYDVIINGTATAVQYTIAYFIDSALVHFEEHNYNDTLTAYVPDALDGYSFGGWTDFPSSGKMPANNIEVHGSYVENDTYTLTYYIGTEEYDSVQYREGDPISPADEPEDIEVGYSFSGWVGEPEVMPAYNSSVNSSLIPNNYLLDYFVDSSLWKSLEYAYNSSIIPQVFERENYIFYGWENEPEVMPAIDHYAVNGSTAQVLYNLQFYSDTSTLYANYNLHYGEQVPQIECNKEGYIFKSWEPELPATMPAYDISTLATYYANSYQLKFITVNYYNQIENLVYDMPVGTAIDSSLYPKPEQYFKYKYVSENTIPEVMPANDLIIYGRYELIDASTEGFIQWYIDGEKLTNGVYQYDTSVYAPISEEEQFIYLWGQYEAFTMPHVARMDIYGERGIIPGQFSKVQWYLDDDTLPILTEVKEWDTLVTAPVSEEDDYNYDWGVYSSFTMPHFAVNAHGTRVAKTIPVPTSHTVYWYLDSSLFTSAVYDISTYVTSPVSSEDNYNYDWGSYASFVMPDYDISIYGTRVAKPEPATSGTVYWYLDSSLFRQGVYQYDTYVMSPESNDIKYVYDWGSYELFEMPHNDISVYGTSTKVGGTVTWYLDDVFFSEGSFLYDASVTSPSSVEQNYDYDWNGYDTFVMPHYDTSVHGERVAKSEPIDPSIYIDSSLFGVSLMEYGTVISHPTVNFGYIENVNHNFSSATADGISAKLYINKPKTIPTNRVMEEIDSYIPVTFKYQISTDGINWTDAVNAELNTDISDKTVENNIVYLPELSSYVYVRLALKSINTQFITQNQITNGTHYSIVFGGHDDYPRPIGQIYDIRSIFALNNNQRNSKYQVFGDFEGFYSHLVDELNSIFNCQMQMHGLILTISNKICHAHRVYEHTAHNYITSGLRYWNGEEYSLDAKTCTIKTAPVILATDIYWYCYWYRWYNCTSLTTAPELPATTLAYGCYRDMFCNCTSLTTAPELPATILAPRCYESMFFGCTSLTTAPELPDRTLAMSCYQGMFYGCTSLTNAPELPSTSLVSNCYTYMFCNCTSLTTAPELPATTLAFECYRGMFYNCSSLVYIPSELPALTVPYGTYAYMFCNCSSLEESLIIRGTSYGKEACEGMFKNCTNLLHRAQLPDVYDAVTGPQDSFGDMYTGCTSLQD